MGEDAVVEKQKAARPLLQALRRFSRMPIYHASAALSTCVTLPFGLHTFGWFVLVAHGYEIWVGGLRSEQGGRIAKQI